jgi:hypothetical protein
MPTPLQLLTDPIALLSFTLYAALLVCETAALPCSHQPRTRGSGRAGASNEEEREECCSARS